MIAEDALTACFMGKMRQDCNAMLTPSKNKLKKFKKIELLERAFRCFEKAFFEVLHVAGKITRVTLPTSCISCSCRSCDSVWCLRDSWRGVSPSLSWTSNLALSRTRSYRKQKAWYKLTWLLGYVEVVGKSTQKGEL